jgi:hypothetical protein
MPFRGKPPITLYNASGMPIIVVCPTELDKKWKFSDQPISDDTVYYDMMQGFKDTRTPEQRLQDLVEFKYHNNWDSQEIGVQCFMDGRWPEKTDLRCWWCLHQFDTRPFPCPVSLKPGEEGVFRIRGVFCGPSCAKAWASVDGNFSNVERVNSLIDILSRMRGYEKVWPIPKAPPRTALNTFCGPEGLTIEEFRGMGLKGFDVHILYPPFITDKQVIVAECEKMSRMARQGRICHENTPGECMMSAVEFVRRRKQGSEIFAGVGARRITDFISSKPK